MDYDTYLDEEVRAFIARSESFHPPNAVELSIQDQRRVYDEMCRAFDQGHPEGVQTHDTMANGVPVRVYQVGSPTVTVIYAHGGGWVTGGLDSHDSICAEMCAGTGYRVLSIDYRLAPEHPHPAAFEDSMAATRWVLDEFDGRIVLVGDSAGGNLVAAVAHAMRGQSDRIAGQLLIYPALGGNRTAGSYATHAHAPGLTLADVTYYDEIRRQGPEPVDDPRFLPLQDSDFSNLPHTVIVTAECDPLSDDGRHYRDTLHGAGVAAHWVNELGLIHGFLRARTMSAKARDSFARIIADVQCLGQGIWPYE